MSRRALRLAVRDTLRLAVASGGLGLDYRTCEVMYDGHPPPRCGEKFVSVHGGTTRNADAETKEDLDEYYSVNVTVTFRLPRLPLDRWGTDIIDRATSGLDDFCQSVKVCIHNDVFDCRVIRAANIYLGAGTDGYSGINGFEEPLAFQSESDDQLRGGEWFHAEGGAEMGIVRQLTFGGARRTQRPDGPLA